MLSHLWLIPALFILLTAEPVPNPEPPPEPAVAEIEQDEECHEPRWAVDEPVVKDLVAWRDEPLKCVFTVRNEGDAELQLHVEPG